MAERKCAGGDFGMSIVTVGVWELLDGSLSSLPLAYDEPARIKLTLSRDLGFRKSAPQV